MILFFFFQKIEINRLHLTVGNSVYSHTQSFCIHHAKYRADCLVSLETIPLHQLSYNVPLQSLTCDVEDPLPDHPNPLEISLPYQVEIFSHLTQF